MVPLGLTNEEFSEAFAEFQRFGPRRRISIQERWLDILETSEHDLIPKLLAQCKEIELFAYGLAKEVMRGDFTESTAREKIAQMFPFLTAVEVNRTLSQAFFYAMH
jgi:hypothetical protein